MKISGNIRFPSAVSNLDNELFRFSINGLLSRNVFDHIICIHKNSY